jgi:hypothetical protein
VRVWVWVCLAACERVCARGATFHWGAGLRGGERERGVSTSARHRRRSSPLGDGSRSATTISNNNNNSGGDHDDKQEEPPSAEPCQRAARAIGPPSVGALDQQVSIGSDRGALPIDDLKHSHTNTVCLRADVYAHTTLHKSSGRDSRQPTPPVVRLSLV